MARVTVAEVKEIIETDLNNTILTGFITSANVLVTQSLGTSGLGVSVLKEIERWLTAHMIVTTRERQAYEEEAGGAKIRYAGRFGEGLSSSTYGQMVLTLDTTGVMAGLGGKKAKLVAIKSFED
jgi:hypothetical protein